MCYGFINLILPDMLSFIDFWKRSSNSYNYLLKTGTEITSMKNRVKGN